MTARRTLAALLVATALSSVGAVTGLAAQPAAAATPGASVIVAPDGGGVLHDGHGLGVTVIVQNTGTGALPAGRIALSLDKAPVASTSYLLGKIADPDQVLLGYLASGATASVPALEAGASASVRVQVKADVLSGILSSASGARLLYARYRSGAVQTVADSSVVKVASGSKASVGLSTVIPLVAPSTSTGVVDIATQEQLTGPDGAWSHALHAAESDPAAAIELDPAVIASIRIAGDAAPPEVAAFLAQLSSLPNEFLRLPYADTDVTLERAAGVRSSLDPSSFASVTLASPATDGPTPAPTATAGTTTSAAAADLTKWNWSDRTVTWPVPHTTSTADLAAFGANGQVLLSSDDLKDTPARKAAGPLARVQSARVLVSDATTSSLLATASAGGPAGDSALATLTGLLATSAVSGETTAVLATIGRTTDAQHLDRVLGLLQGQSWIRSTSLSDLGDGSNAAAAGLQARSVPSARVATARSLLSGERQVQALGKAVLTGADTVTAPQRLALLGTLSSAWRGDDTGWGTAATAAEGGFTKVLGLVHLVKQAPANLVGGDGTLPVVVANALPVPVRMTVHAGVSNGAVQFTSPSQTIIVPANGRQPAKLGFRSIRNGRTDLTLSLTTPLGAPIGSEVNRGATVRAGFDTIVAVTLLAALALLLALGVYRNVKRRRQPRAAAAA